MSKKNLRLFPARTAITAPRSWLVRPGIVLGTSSLARLLSTGLCYVPSCFAGLPVHFGAVQLTGTCV